MNERAREALVTAALNGVRQIKEVHKDDTGGRCAMGVIYEACGVPITATSPGGNEAKNIGISLDEYHQIVFANDIAGWDFLTISRKIGVTEEGA